MIKIEINRVEFFVKPNTSVLEACESAGIDVPRFCYHQSLSVAGNCRMCLVEVANSVKPVASCALPVLNNIKIFTDSPLVQKARENVLETLLLNHPLDCPICDQGGECDLQDQSKNFGVDISRYFSKKRVVDDKPCNNLIKTIMTRCIHCTRCVRFNTEVSGNDFLGTLNRGFETEVGSYSGGSTYFSEISANVIDLCPVGALTSKPYAFKARPWELKTSDSIDLSDGCGSNIYVSHKESEIVRIFPKVNYEINNNIISDKARFSFDYTVKNRLLSKNSVDNHSSILLHNVLKSDVKKQRALFLVDGHLDFNNLAFLKSLGNQSFFEKKKLKNYSIITDLMSLSNSSKTTNFAISNIVNPIIDIEKCDRFCIILFSNLRLESAVINTKLRTKFLQKNLVLFGFSTFFNNTFKINFLNLSLSKFYEVLEAKSLKISKLLINYKNPLFIFNSNLFSRGLDLKFFINCVKKISNSAIVLNINTLSNVESIKLLNLIRFNTRTIQKAIHFFAFNIEGSFLLKKYIFHSLRNQNEYFAYWFNTHGSEFLSNNKNIIAFPCYTEYEFSSIFINLEQRPQRTSQILKLREDLSIIRCLKQMLDIGEGFNFYKLHLSYISELLTKNTIFLKFAQTSFYKYYLLNVIYKSVSDRVSLYPFKILVEDFYLCNKNSKNSSTMQNCSKIYRHVESNF